MNKLIDFNHLLVSSKEYIGIFRKDVTHIISDPLYPEAVHILANIFKSLADKSLLRLKTCSKEYTSFIETYSTGDKAVEFKLQPKLYDLRTEVEGILDYFKYLAGLLRYIKSASIESTPQGLLYPFQKLINFISPRAYIFLRKQWKHNYKFGEFIMQTLNPQKIPQLLEDYAKNEVNFSLCMVSYPNECDDNYLYNCSISHEVGHYLDLLNPFISSREDFSTKLGLLKIDKDYKGRIVEVGYKWLIEFMADIYATIILGPAYLFSFLEFNEVVSDKTLDDVIIEGEHLYPSTRMRLYIIMKTLEYKKFKLMRSFKKLKDQDNWIKITYDKLLSVKSEIKHNQFPNKKRLTEEGIVPSSAEIYLSAWKINKINAIKYIENACGIFEDVFSKKEYGKETIRNEYIYNIELIEDMRNKLLNGIPINEIIDDKTTHCTEPLSSYLILNFGWMRLLELLEHNKNDEEKLRKQVVITKTLIQRSIEASYLHQQYKEQREQIKRL